MSGSLLILRADARPEIGTGHVMRSLALAAAWQAAGGRTAFVTHCTSPSLRERIRAAGSRLVPIDNLQRDPQAVASSLGPLLDAERGSEPAWVALDGYHFAERCQRAICDLGCRLLVIDDLAEHARYHADVLLNQNLGAEWIDYPADGRTPRLLGPRYALLRPEFLAWRTWQRQTPRVARKVLVTLGGSDPHNVTRRVLQALAATRLAGLQARVVIGPSSAHAESLRAMAGGSPTGIELLENPADMPSLMAWADVAVCAAGSTCWELAFMQLPALALVLADNQQPIARRLDAAGVVENMGWAEQVTAAAIARSLADFCSDRPTRVAQSAAGPRLVDGLGAQRVTAVLRAMDGPLPEAESLLRRATPDDLLPLWRLANEPSVLRTSLTEHGSTLDQYGPWFEQRLASPESRCWVLDFQGLILGLVRYDRRATEPHAEREEYEEAAEISISVAAPFRRRGLGLRLLQLTRQPAGRELGVPRLRAVVREENTPSQELFGRAGFAYVESRRVDGKACPVYEIRAS